ncbi:MAG TPA: Holliday junction resolvase RuvX [Candidatus Paceibacterota bacterium]|jgi:putative Holliday junction resolvase|nr:Holliday junction resolvase RuvX [Candidatus Paceibacterota bacterium]
MRLIGIDYGKKRVGVAISDDKGMMAFPKAVLPNDNYLMTELRSLIKAHHIVTAVVGESKDFGMRDNPIMQDVRRFAAELEREAGVVVIYEPELLSSHQAAQVGHTLGKTDMIDASAASIILQSYIDRQAFK